MKKLLNDQITMEGYASSYYLSMASWAEITGYDGAAKYFYLQADEERQHMLKIIHFLNELGVGATVPSIKQPPQTFKSFESLFKTALKNEQAVTKAIHKMVEIAQKEKDHASFDFLQWFVKEQVQEETKFETILQKFNLIGRDKLAINEIDKSLASMEEAPAETQN